jgi:hypothetical protein
MFPNIKRVPLTVFSTTPEMLESHSESLEYLILNKFINVSEENIKELFACEFQNYNIIEYILCNHDIKKVYKKIGFDVAISNNNIQVAKLIYSHIENKKEFETSIVGGFMEHTSQNLNLSIETFDYIWELFHNGFYYDLVVMINIINPKNLILLEYIMDKVSKDINGNKLAQIIESLSFDNDNVPVVDLMMKKFGHLFHH